MEHNEDNGEHAKNIKEITLSLIIKNKLLLHMNKETQQISNVMYEPSMVVLLIPALGKQR